MTYNGGAVAKWLSETSGPGSTPRRGHYDLSVVVHV